METNTIDKLDEATPRPTGRDPGHATANVREGTTRTVLVAELKCYLCGTISGTIESERQPLPPTVLLRRPGENEAIPVLDWRRLRCARCGGPVFLDETDVVIRRSEVHDWSDERPRRGRPPKRLVEERRRQQDAAKPRAA